MWVDTCTLCPGTQSPFAGLETLEVQCSFLAKFHSQIGKVPLIRQPLCSKNFGLVAVLVNATYCDDFFDDNLIFLTGGLGVAVSFSVCL